MDPETRKRRASNPTSKRQRNKRERILALPTSFGAPTGELKGFDTACGTTIAGAYSFMIFKRGVEAYAVNPSGYQDKTRACLNCIANGASSGDRVGRKISMKSLHFKMYVRPGTSWARSDEANDLSLLYRILIVYDRGHSGAAAPLPAATLLAASTGTVSNAIESETLNGISLAYRDRIKVLYDERFSWSNVNQGSETTPQGRWFEKFINLKGAEAVYNTSTPSISDIQTGAINLYLLSDHAPNTGGVLIGQFSSRLRYYDA